MAPRGVKFQPTDEHRGQVRAMAGFGLPHADIAVVMSLTKDTLYKYFREELDNGKAVGNLAIARSLQEQGVGRPAEYNEKGKLVREELKPDRSVAIFLGKARLGLKDTQYISTSINDLDLSKLTEAEVLQLEKLLAKAAKRPPADAG